MSVTEKKIPSKCEEWKNLKYLAFCRVLRPVFGTCDPLEFKQRLSSSSRQPKSGPCHRDSQKAAPAAKKIFKNEQTKPFYRCAATT